MAPETLRAMAPNMFTPGNYFYNGVGHVTVQYEKVLAVGFEGIMGGSSSRNWRAAAWETRIMPRSMCCWNPC